MFRVFHGKSKNLTDICPLCHSEKTKLFCTHETGVYNHCQECDLVFVLKTHHLDEQEEKERYDLHTNSPEDMGYRKYLRKVLDPTLERVSKDAVGLDFGSGPGPTLSLMFEEAGHDMSIYDHYYANDASVLQQQYDFITSTEVIEHLYDPSSVMKKLWSMLNSNGVLVLLTQPYSDTIDFSSWYYKNDPTHVCFFSHDTMKWIAEQWKAELEIIGNDLFIFKKV